MLHCQSKGNVCGLCLVHFHPSYVASFCFQIGFNVSHCYYYSRKQDDPPNPPIKTHKQTNCYLSLELQRFVFNCLKCNIFYFFIPYTEDICSTALENMPKVFSAYTPLLSFIPVRLLFPTSSNPVFTTTLHVGNQKSRYTLYLGT